MHQFGYASTSAVAKACIDIIRDKAINRGLLALARALQFIYVDDINTSVDTKQELDSLQSQITEVLNEHGFPLKGWALSNMAPDASLSENDYTMVGGWKWFSEQDIISLQTPPIFLGEKKRGIFDKNTTFLHPNPTHKDIANLYKDVTITLPHIVSRTAMLFDMSGMSTPLIVFGNYLSRQALLDTKGEQNKQISPQTRKLFITYLHLVSQFGQLTFPRNMKRADHTQKATLLAFADSSASCWIVVLYLLRLDHNKTFFAEFLYSVGGLNPLDRTIPRSELNSYSKAAQVVDNVQVVVSETIRDKYLVADNKIAF